MMLPCNPLGTIKVVNPSTMMRLLATWGGLGGGGILPVRMRPGRLGPTSVLMNACKTLTAWQMTGTALATHVIDTINLTPYRLTHEMLDPGVQL